MRFTPVLAVACLLVAGCSEQPSGVTPTSTSSSATSSTRSSGPSVDPGTTASQKTDTGQAAQTSSSDQPASQSVAAIVSGSTELKPENSKVVFVGTHVGDRPDRTGGFEKFAGQAAIDSTTNALKTVALEIDTGSLWTQFAPLTNHLKSPDFLDAVEYPSISFQSTRIEPAEGESGNTRITGNLTLHGVTKEITIPATTSVNDGVLSLTSSFKIDRTEFGMDKLLDQVVKDVALTVVIGEKTEPLPQLAMGGGGRGGAGGGGFDPVAMFKRSDADSDGKLTGDEIPERMKQDLEQIDTDGDGSVTLEEFQARMRQLGGRGRPGGGPGGAAGSGQESQPEGKN